MSHKEKRALFALSIVVSPLLSQIHEHCNEAIMYQALNHHRTNPNPDTTLSHHPLPPHHMACYTAESGMELELGIEATEKITHYVGRTKKRTSCRHGASGLSVEDLTGNIKPYADDQKGLMSDPLSLAQERRES